MGYYVPAKCFPRTVALRDFLRIISSVIPVLNYSSVNINRFAFLLLPWYKTGIKTEDSRLRPAVAKEKPLFANLKPARIRGVESQ